MPLRIHTQCWGIHKTGVNNLLPVLKFMCRVNSSMAHFKQKKLFTKNMKYNSDQFGCQHVRAIIVIDSEPVEKKCDRCNHGKW